MRTNTDLWAVHDSPVGPLTLRGSAGRLCALDFPGHGAHREESGWAPEAFADALAQLEDYFAGRRREFELRLDLGGTPFQRRIWAALQGIPYGETISYTELARAIGRPDRLRAAAAAVGRTPVPIVVPCHRVVATDGGLTGYRGGLARKRALLELERRVGAGGVPEPAWSFRQTALL
jgi:methylated-DNA-[protein]-cysteine S-methyltransferase